MAKAKKEKDLKKDEEVREFDLESIKEDLKGYIDQTVKNDLTLYIEKKVKDEFADDIDRVYKKIIREKNYKLFFKNIIILLLLGVIIFLLYLMYDADYFDSYFHLKEDHKDKTVEEVPKDSLEKEEEPKSPTLDELKEEYSGLLDSVVLASNSSYIHDFYNGNLTNELKSYFTLSQMDFSSFEVEDDYYVIDEETFKNTYLSYFDDYSAVGFDYGDSRVRYFSKLESYVSDSLFDSISSDIVREIKSIEVKDGEVFITTVEGKIVDQQLMNILSSDVVDSYQNDSLLNYSSYLNEITYVFKNGKLIHLASHF